MDIAVVAVGAYPPGPLLCLLLVPGAIAEGLSFCQRNFALSLPKEQHHKTAIVFCADLIGPRNNLLPHLPEIGSELLRIKFNCADQQGQRHHACNHGHHLPVIEAPEKKSQRHDHGDGEQQNDLGRKNREQFRNLGQFANTEHIAVHQVINILPHIRQEKRHRRQQRLPARWPQHHVKRAVKIKQQG